MGGFPQPQNESRQASQRLRLLEQGLRVSRLRTQELPGGPRPRRWQQLDSLLKSKGEGRRAGEVTRPGAEKSAGERRRLTLKSSFILPNSGTAIVKHGDPGETTAKLASLQRSPVRPSCSSDETDSKGKDRLLEISADVRDSENQEKDRESQILGFKVSALGKIPVKENQGEGLNLGVETYGSKRHAGKSASVTRIQECSSMRSDSTKNFSADVPATEKKSQDEGLNLNLFSPRETVRSEFLSVAQSRNQSLASLAIKFLQEEKAEAHNHNQVPNVRALMESEEQASLEPESGRWPRAVLSACQQPLHSAQHHTSKSPFTSQMDVADRKTLPSSLGLEWVPELYPAYLGLGVFPGKPQYWNPVAQKPQLISPHGERLSQGKMHSFSRAVQPIQTTLCLLNS
ncbi:hypothetical protein PAL_GLEAN10014793 [Pteropus alecto]|uniref:Uncharacterized protein n=1 Tax=Pteropus alecto TaxID=9402 RepID=L5KNH0_PTEAL|nr:hypothetical protein PAL_GLEAN10014793 [Pteropus alecto]